MIQRRVLLAGLLLLCAGVRLQAQATFDAQSSSIELFTSAANTQVFTHTTGAGTNRLLLVSVHMNITDQIGATVTDVEYNNTDLTLLDAIGDASDDTRTEVWYLLNPPVGTFNVDVTVGGLGAGDTVNAVLGATTFSNADQSAPASTANAGQNTPVSTTLNGTAATDLVLDFLSVRESVTSTANAAQTAGYAQTTGTGTDDVDARSSGRTAATPNTAMSWTISANRFWSHIVVGVRRASADVEVTQSANPDPIEPGGILAYTFRVQNNGPAAATGVTLSDPLPAATTFVTVWMAACSAASSSAPMVFTSVK